ncbi:hypothetical protein COOONC_05350 [Cooperia oncophora]
MPHPQVQRSARTVFTATPVIETREPAMCMLSTAKGFFFGADSFYSVQLSRGQVEPVCLIESTVADYPIALLQIREDEVLLAYQNYGIFVNSRGERTRNQMVEWEHMPMEFVFTAPYLYVVHYDSLEILQVAEYAGLDSCTILDEREVFGMLPSKWRCFHFHLEYGQCGSASFQRNQQQTKCCEAKRIDGHHIR